MIVHRRGVLDDADLVAEVTSSARLLLDNERLQADVRAKEADLRASRARIVESGDAERRRLERDLHDGAQQRLVGLMLGLRLARASVDAGDEELRARLGATERELELATGSLRDVATRDPPGGAQHVRAVRGARRARRAIGNPVAGHGRPPRPAPTGRGNRRLPHRRRSGGDGRCRRRVASLGGTACDVDVEATPSRTR